MRAAFVPSDFDAVVEGIPLFRPPLFIEDRRRYFIFGMFFVVGLSSFEV